MLHATLEYFVFSAVSPDVLIFHSVREKFKGICSQPEFAAAIRQSFASQTWAVLVAAGDRQTDQSYDLSSCTTCELIAEGSSMAYSDHTCPQCGADTYHLTDPLKLIY